jgi:7-cyano-7-deazaguanine synthase
MTNAIVLCSGGIDSVTTAHYAKKKLGYEKLIILFFNYGQKTLEREREFSKKCAEELGGNFKEFELSWLGELSNSLINKNGQINELSEADLKNTKEESKNWYVPCRNTIFLVQALAYAEALSIKENQEYDLFVGFKFDGEGGYPDTTSEFVEKMNELSEIGCSKEIKIIAPLIKKDKEEIIQLGINLGIDMKCTYSCYVGKEKHCGKCLACQLRKAGFKWSGIKDVTKYD